MADAKFILDDIVLMSRNLITGRPEGTVNGKSFDEEYFGPQGKYLGHGVCAMPFEMYTKINPTTAPGMTTGIWQSLLIQLRKWEFNGVKKIQETIEVTPAYAQYYQITLKQKEEIEARIKAGLQSISQSIADLELLKHDERKYREFLDYFGLKFTPDSKEPWTETGKKDEHSIKSVFIDQVDAHLGEGIAMRNIVSRWPTLITDFMRFGNEVDTNKIAKELDVSKAEAVVLSSKNRLYQEWKKLFEPELKSRYMKISELVRSREVSVEEYRNWLKPYIARHKMLAEGLEGGHGNYTAGSNFMHENYLYSPFLGFSANSTRMWAWRFHTTTEYYRAAGSERLATEMLEGTIKPDDIWTRKNLIFHPKHGLVVKYPWITDKWIDSKKADIMAWMVPRKEYYAFFILQSNKMNIRYASGEEIEDNDFFIYGIYMSKNVLFVKLLEYMAIQDEFNAYVDRLLGLRPHMAGEISGEIKEAYQKKSGFQENMESLGETLEEIGMTFQFMRKMPYEKVFDERLGKLHLRSMAAERYAPIVNFLKTKFGIGK